MRANQESDNPVPPPLKMTLHAFIQQNDKLLTALGVFTAVTVFVGELPLKPIASVLSLLFMSLTVILWLELLGRFPKQGVGQSIQWFEILLSFAVFVLVAYWLLDYRSLWKDWLFIPMAAILVRLTSSIAKRYDLFNRTFNAKPGERRTLRYWLWAALTVGSLVLAYFAATFLAPWINRLLDEIARSMSAPAP